MVRIGLLLTQLILYVSLSVGQYFVVYLDNNLSIEEFPVCCGSDIISNGMTAAVEGGASTHYGSQFGAHSNKGVSKGECRKALYP